MTHERDPLDSEQELAKTQMPGHPLRMPDPHRARTPALPPAASQAARAPRSPGER
jgi:hypothetical protein